MKKQRNKRRRIVFGMAAGLVLVCLGVFVTLASAGAFSPDEVTAWHEVVAPAGATAATVAIDIPAGMLDVSAGNSALLDADFHHSSTQPKPHVQYERRGDGGTLLVQQPAQEQTGLRRPTNRWELQLHQRIPLTLQVTAGAGAHSLDLRSLAVQHAAITLRGSSITAVNLGSYWQEDVDVTLQGGAGLLQIILPQGTGARVDLENHAGDVKVDGLTAHEDGPHDTYVNDTYGNSPQTVRVHVADYRGDVSLTAGLPGDVPVAEAIGLAKLVYSKHGPFNCDAIPDDGQYLPTDSVRDLWYDYLCERGPDHRVFDGDDALTRELAESELIDQIRRVYYRQEKTITGATMKFNVEEFLSATVDMLLKARKQPENREFSLTHFMGSFTYTVERIGGRLHFSIVNQTDLASGTHLPLRFPDTGYTQSLETLVAQHPALADAYLLELVQSNHYPIISVLAAKSRQETSDAAGEGGGNFRQTFTWSEPYLATFDHLPPWPDYVQQLDIR